MSEAKLRIEQVAADLGITMSAEFVPWRLSRSKGEKHPSLNWRVTLWRAAVNSIGKACILTTDYMAGCGHCPGYKQRETEESRAVVRWECENGKTGRYYTTTARVSSAVTNKPILPELADVLSSLVTDSGALDYPTFEEWAGEFGYETDSRKAEAIYRACLETALKLRSALGEDGLSRLREACQDY